MNKAVPPCVVTLLNLEAEKKYYLIGSRYDKMRTTLSIKSFESSSTSPVACMISFQLTLYDLLWREQGNWNLAIICLDIYCV